MNRSRPSGHLSEQLSGGLRMISRTTILIAASVFASVTPSAAKAEVLKFHVALDGKSGPEPTGSPATGTARVRVDTVTRRGGGGGGETAITIEEI